MLMLEVVYWYRPYKNYFYYKEDNDLDTPIEENKVQEVDWFFLGWLPLAKILGINEDPTKPYDIKNMHIFGNARI